MSATKLKRLRERFPGKVIQRIVSFTKKSNFNFRERLVYSILVYRARSKETYLGAKISRIAKLSRLHRATVKKILTVLIDNDLAYYHQGKKRYGYKKPKDESRHWFAFFGDENAHVRNYFGYQYTIMPAINSPLTVVDCAIAIQDFLEPGLINARISGRLGVDLRTVRRSRAKMRRLGHLEARYFQDREQERKASDTSAAAPPVSEPAKAPATPNLTRNTVTEFLLQRYRLDSNSSLGTAFKHACSRLIEANFPPKDIQKYFAAMIYHYGIDDGLFMQLMELPSKLQQTLSIHGRKGRRDRSGVDLLLAISLPKQPKPQADEDTEEYEYDDGDDD